MPPCAFRDLQIKGSLRGFFFKVNDIADGAGFARKCPHSVIGGPCRTGVSQAQSPLPVFLLDRFKVDDQTESVTCVSIPDLRRKFYPGFAAGMTEEVAVHFERLAAGSTGHDFAAGQQRIFTFKADFSLFKRRGGESCFKALSLSAREVDRRDGEAVAFALFQKSAAPGTGNFFARMLFPECAVVIFAGNAFASLKEFRFVNITVFNLFNFGESEQNTADFSFLRE